MAVLSGAVATASGLFYQYLFTIETFFTLINDSWPEATEVRIEDPDDPSVLDPDVVDFSVYHPDQGLYALYQAKSVVVPDISTISASEALVTLIRLIGSAECPKYFLVTNARPGRDLERLNEILAGKLSDKELLAELRGVVGNSDIAVTALANVRTPEQIARLRHARVQATGERSDAIRSRIAASIRSWRSDQNLSLGERAARILENSLITEIFVHASRASGSMHIVYESGYRAITLTSFKELLAPGKEVLAQAAARIEAGAGIHHVPSGDGISRPQQLQKLLEHFGNVRSRKAPFCALVGASGIGKTRLAAMFAHREREAYDRVCWLDAESDAAIVASIINQHKAIGLDHIDGRDPNEVADSFRECVSTFIGRWLIVFDNATDARQVQRWITSAGNAQFLVTSTNAVDWTAFSPIEVPGMDPGEALDLLKSRLKDDLQTESDEQRKRAEQAMSRLARELEWRPLALQIAASHFETMSALVHGLATYTATITDYMARIIDDERLDLDGYPRTLQAAINICLDRLVQAADDVDGLTALQMLQASSVLSSRSVPVWLLFATALEPALTEIRSTRPRSGLRAHVPAVNSALRRIRTQSLMERRDDSTHQLSWELQRRFDVNEIVQYVIRQRLEELVPVLDGVAAHLAGWIGGYMNRQDFASATVVQPHALQILSLAKGVEGDVRSCAVLAGNISLFLNVQGRSAEAISWLKFEYQLLLQLPTPSYPLIAQTVVQIVDAMLRTGAAYSEMRPYLFSGVDAAEIAAKSGELQWDGWSVCVNLTEAISVCSRRAENDEASRQEFDPLRQRLTELRALFPSSEAAGQHHLASAVEQEIENGNHERALALSDNIVQSLDPHNHVLRLQMRLQRLESLAALGLHDRLDAELSDFITDHGNNRQVTVGIAQSLLNTASRVAFEIMQGTDEQGPAQQIFSRLTCTSYTLCNNEYERYWHILLAACERSHCGDVHGVRALVELACSKRPTQIPMSVRDKASAPPYAVTLHSWLDYWLQCSEMGVRARAVSGSALSRPYPVGAGDEGLVVCIFAAELNNEIRSTASTSQVFEGHWRHDFFGFGRALDLWTAGSGTPIARILLCTEPAVRATPGPSGGPIRVFRNEDVSDATLILMTSTATKEFVIVEIH